VDSSDWMAETEETGEFLEKFGDHLPPELRQEHANLSKRLSLVASARK
jgi:GTP-dependent phosphoenolpyruvate carboxykinase